MSTTKKDTRSVTLSWQSGQAFSAVSGSGHSVTLDGNVEDGQSPMEALLSALGGCMGIDIVHILEKMRVPFGALAIEVEGTRRESEPRSFHRIVLRFRFTGAMPADKAARAVELSLDKYCSVFHSFRTDIDVATEIDIVATANA